MPKKAKSKARLDKYYYLAKEHGYRSRAAFKLIQLNQKYDFLSKAVCLVDLCAAPGGWLQVATKYMPLNSVKIGVDLVPIRNVSGCMTFQADITTPKCLALIKREIKHVKADVVLHDGAPNVGAQWNKDAYTQSELVLSALKLATQLLRSGGAFVTKVFRSKDYATLLTVFKKLFRRVVATKPKASREASAEIFVICTGYNAPSVVEPHLLDPKVVFNDSAPDKKDLVFSLKQLLEEKRHRSGYNDDGKGFVYGKVKLSAFIKAVNPFQTLKECTELNIDEEAKKYIEKVPPPPFLEQTCKDIKVLGKGELNTLLKWRTKVLHNVAREKREEEEKAMGEIQRDEPKAEERPVDEEAELEKILAERDKRVEKGKKKIGERIAKRKVKCHEGQFAGEDNVDEDLGFDELLEEGEDLDEVGYVSLSDTDDEIERQGYSLKKDDDSDAEKNKDKENEGEGEDEDDDDKRIDTMNREMEEQFAKETEESTLKRKIKNKAKKFEKDDEEGEELKDVQGEDMKDSDDDNVIVQKETEISKDKEPKPDDKFVNPLKAKIHEIVADNEGPPTEEATKKAKKRARPEKSKHDDDDNSDPDEPKGLKKEKTERDLRKDKKRKQRERLELHGKVHNAGFEEVPADFDEGMDSDAIAETVAIAKLMLRKKDRDNIIDASYNRYVFEDSKNAMPVWFMEDEEKHNKPQLPVTREMIEAEKERLKDFNVKTPKKVLEARARKKNKIAKKLDKLKRKAQVIVNQEDISEASKFRQIEKMYKKEKATKKDDKKYVVAKSFSSGKKMKSHGKNVKFVDKRMKKDIRAQKRIDKKTRGFKSHTHRGKKRG